MVKQTKKQGSASGRAQANQKSKKAAKPMTARAMMSLPAGLGDAAARYAAALLNPFSKEAEGVRVPEPYAIATIVRKVHVPLTLTSSAAGGLDFIVQPHLVNSFWQTLGTATGGAGSITISNMPANLTARAAVDKSALANAYQTYRIVAAGVRIKTNIDFTKSGGRVYGAVMPAGVEVPAQFNGGTSLAQALGCLEVPNDGNNVTTSVVALPRGFQFSVSELMSEGGCEVHFPICSARALDFLDAQPQSNEQHLAVNSAGGAYIASFGLGEYQTAGHSQFVLRAEGLAASTDVFTVEVIYHVEGIPVVGTANLVESMPHTPAPSSPNEMHLAHRLAAAAPVVSYVSDKLRAAGAAGGKYAGFARRAGQVAGAAERVLGIAVRGLA